MSANASGAVNECVDWRILHIQAGMTHKMG